MGKWIRYEHGDSIGDNGISFVKYVITDKYKPKKAVLRCSCGNEFVSIVASVKFGNTSSCGCAKSNKPIHIYKHGDMFGEFVFIEELEPITYTGTTKRMALFKCHCGKVFKNDISHIKNGMARGCGCVRSKNASMLKYSHGMHGHPAYMAWIRIKDRCYNRNNSAYKNYGGRGIFLDDKFLNNPKYFVEYVTSLDDYGTHGYTIDRIDNDGGYVIGNLRWASRHIQAVNKRHPKGDSGFTGVTRSCKKWRSNIGLCDKWLLIGTYNTPEEAAIARDKYIIENNLPHRLSGLLLY